MRRLLILRLRASPAMQAVSGAVVARARTGDVGATVAAEPAE
jgi:hypothetical protein